AISLPGGGLVSTPNIFLAVPWPACGPKYAGGNRLVTWSVELWNMCPVRLKRRSNWILISAIHGRNGPRFWICLRETMLKVISCTLGHRAFPRSGIGGGTLA